MMTIWATGMLAALLAVGCEREDRPPTPASRELPAVSMVVAGQSFTVALQDNTTAEAFCNLLPMTLEMNELNGNEKYHYLSSPLPTNSTRPDTIHTGDIMLYGDDCVVVFYETFATRYAYSPIGRVEAPAGLRDAVGEGRVTVTFKIEENKTTQNN